MLAVDGNGSVAAAASRAASSRDVRAMALILVDASATRLPDAPERLAHLRDAGHELVVVGPTQVPHEAALDADTVDRLPDDVPRGAWFVTADPSTCVDHRATVRTVLVGPRRDERRPTRCDTTARDLREAVLEILAAESIR